MEKLQIRTKPDRDMKDKGMLKPLG